ncbi:hypothetical protein PVAP13_2NG309424 [Panicum virgatum]|uniref:Strictosidine synthase conserved region domain-containing protein n=1 Tax=Panicum virgatum TaxID=38727 RepID=A0A8T0VHQ8_PANVG|nr:hypothetical protein PVAP13_2NG309424 [Panicum virgatum]
MEAAKCSPATLLLLLVRSPATMVVTCREEMESVYVGRRILHVRLGRPAFGPESLAFDHRGDGPYTGVSNGRVLRWRGPLRGWTEFAHNHKARLLLMTVAACAAKRRAAAAPESACGRPLGLQFHRASGDLYFADAYLGLMRVGRRGGRAEAVAAEAGGAPLNFANGVDVDQEAGHVYFTDSSATFQRSDYLMITGDTTGRLLRADGTHLVVAETARCRLLRHWLRGPRAGATEPFADLPGYPDNVRLAGGDGSSSSSSYWVALNRDKAWMEEGTTPRSVAAVRVRAADGAVDRALRGLGNATVREVVERPGGALWLGSVDTPYVGL